MAEREMTEESMAERRTTENSMTKGTLGYIEAYKKRYGLYTLGLAGLILAAAVAVFLIFGTVKHVAVIIPVILALPFAKLLILWVIVVKFHSLKKEQGEYLEDSLKERQNCIILYDMALSSYETVSFAPALVIDQGNIYLLWGDSNEKSYGSQQQQEYVQGIVEKTGYHYSVFSAASVEELVEQVKGSSISEEDLSLKCDRLKQRMLDVCV